MVNLTPGSRAELRVDRLSLGGDAVGRAGNCVVFVPYGCPGDTLEVEITEAHRNYARARLLRVLTSSPQRIKPPCPYHFQAEQTPKGEGRQEKGDEPLASRPSPI